MIEDKLKNEIAKITTALLEKTESTISGALLGELLPIVTPDLSIREVMKIHTGPGALKKFVDSHLKNILKPSHKQGSDIVYLIIREESEETIAINADIWHTFVRTNSPKRLFLQGNILQIAEADEEDPVDGKEIRSATNDELNQIRIDFINSLGETGSSLPDMKAPYTEWSVALKKLSRQQYRNWTEYRLRKIEELFEKRIDSLGIDKKSRGDVISQLKRSQLAAKDLIGTKRIQHNSKNLVSEQEENQDTNPSDANLRSAILEVIKKLSILELRALKLPAGEIADALIRQNMK